MRLPTAIAALVLAWSSPAWADPKDDARRHFVAGLEAAKARDFDTALDRFLAAQDAWPHPATLYNIARTYSDLGDLDQALAYYRLYRDAAPDRADEVDPVIAVLEARLSQAAPAPATGGAVSSDEVARLAALAAELEQIASALAERPVADAASDDDTPAPDLSDGEIEGDLIDEAYQRVVVTASRYGQEPLDSPSTISVLTADDIRLSGATSVPELLRRVAGVDAMSLSAGHTDVSIRGFNRELSNKVLVLVDGRSTYWDFIGTTLWSSLPVALEEIERIEVIRGPGSAVYGANAVTGVINIVTRTPGDGADAVRVSVGTPGFAQGTVVATGRDDVSAWRVSAGYDQAARWARDFDPAAHTAVVPFAGDGDTAVRMVRAHSRIDRRFLDTGLASLTAGYSQGFTEFYNLGALGGFGLDARHTTLRGDVSWGPVHLRAFWNTVDGRTGPWTEPVGTPRSLATDIDSDTVDVELESSGELTTGPVHHRLNGGIGYRFKHIADFLFLGKDGPTIQEHHTSAFLNDEATLDRLKVVGSLRADLHPLLPVGQTLSPRGAAIYRIRERTSVRLSGGTAFRQPTLVESYMDFALPTTRDGLFIRDFGDTSLRPERIATVEVGVHDESSPMHVADVAVYVNQVRDLIDLESVRPTLTPFEPDASGWQAGTSGWSNRPEVYTGVGVEADTEWFPTDGVDLFVNGSLSRIVEATADGTRADRSSSLVRLNLGGAWRTPWRTDLSASAQFSSPQTWRLREFDAAGRLIAVEYDVPARVVLSARLAVRPLPNERLELSGTLWNPLGGVVEHPKGQPVGTRAFVTVAYAL